MGNEEEEVEEGNVVCMGKTIPHTSWDTRRARGVPRKRFLSVLRLHPDAFFQTPFAREVSQEVWDVFFSKQAGLPRIGNLQIGGGGVRGGSCEGVWGSFLELLGSVPAACWRPGGRISSLLRA